jgi:hypothetical protein
MEKILYKFIRKFWGTAMAGKIMGFFLVPNCKHRYGKPTALMPPQCEKCGEYKKFSSEFN